MFTFMLAEIIWQAFTMINNPQLRATRPEADTPRKLMRVILHFRPLCQSPNSRFSGRALSPR